MHFEVSKGEFLISTDPARLDLDAVVAFLSATYWASNRPRQVFERAIRHSLCFGLYTAGRQIGFARAITDYATFGYLADVFILEQFRRRGLGEWLVRTILSHPQLSHLRRWCLMTRDMHSLYNKCGFTAPERPGDYMEKTQPYPQST